MDEQLVLKNRLKVARAERGLSQGDLAKLVGVSRQTISSIETSCSSMSSPSLCEVSDLAKLVGVSRQTISSIETGQFNPTAKLALVLCIALDKKFEELFYF